MSQSLELSIALASLNDLPRIAPLWAQDMHGGQARDAKETMATRQVTRHANAGCDFWLAATDSNSIGFAYGQQVGGAYELSWVYVAPEHRGKGIGLELARSVANYANNRGASHLSMLFPTEDRPSRALVEALCRTQTRTEIEGSEARIIF